MVKIFLSHCSDDLPIFDEIAKRLSIKDAEWYVAERDPDTRTLSEKVIQHLSEADLVVLLLTPRAKASEFVNQEIGFAVHAKKRIVIVRIEDSNPGGFLTGLEYTNYDGKVETSIEKIEEHLRTTIKRVYSEQVDLGGENFAELRRYHQAAATRILDLNRLLETTDPQKIVLHIFPYNHARQPKEYKVQTDSFLKKLAPICSHDRSPRITAKGVESKSQINAGDGNPDSYVGVAKNGIVEAVDGRLFANTKRHVEPEHPRLFSIRDVAEIIMDGVKSYVGLLEEADIDFPVVVYITLLDVRGYKAVELRYDADRTPILEDNLELGPCIIRSIEDVEVGLRPAFDTLAQACGMRDASFLNKK